ncbi:MAG: hypothetical protein U1E87_02215 [Alphaproteobacteria bacterium]
MTLRRAAFLALSLIGFPGAPARAAEAPAPCTNCAYHFLQLAMPSDRFARSMIPLFDNKLTFDAFTNYLDEQHIFWSLNDICMGVSEFPANTQKVLAGFGPGDNLLGKAGGSLLILKIQRLHPSRQACLADLPARDSRATSTKQPDPPDTNTRR